MAISRRKFLVSASAFGGIMTLPKWVIGKEKSPNEKLNVAIVGVGGRGRATVDAVSHAPNANMVAFCDVDDIRAADVYKKFPNVPKFRDYRVMLDKMDKDIDAVAVCTPDHMHYPISAWAMAKGKHVFCEKPLTRTIWESRELKRLANKFGVMTQMGNQGHTHEGWRVVREWYESGLLGQIEDIYMWTDRPIWPQGNISPAQEEQIPTTLDYNLWLGIAPDLYPYSKEILPFNWRGLRMFGTGAAGDMACHFFDTSYSALDLGVPSTIVADAPEANDYSWPQDSNIEMVFDNQRGVGGKIRLHWYDGGRKPKEIKNVDPSFIADERNKNCTFIVGTKETVNTTHYGVGTILHPREKMVEAKKNGKLPEAKYVRSETPGNPQQGWINSCISGKKSESNFDYAAPFNELVLLGMVGVLMPQQELKYDQTKMTFSNCPEADKYIKSLYDYREEFLPKGI